MYRRNGICGGFSGFRGEGLGGGVGGNEERPESLVDAVRGAIVRGDESGLAPWATKN